MHSEQVIDHLFRHQFGKMVSILTRIFGLQHLETIEDAVQDTFIKAVATWRDEIPENPEAWLTKAAKNRVIDLFRKLSSEKHRGGLFENGTVSIALNELFLDDEIEDAQLRMIFTACHPYMDPRDQIAFALKTIAGFSQKEIAAALLLKDETIKKRLVRARKTIKERNIKFCIPQGQELSNRIHRVQEVLYLIFNEGFHSTRKDRVVRKELCGEALRLTNLLRSNEVTCTPDIHALFALMCFHSARVESKVTNGDLLIDLKSQDRSLWHMPLVWLGNEAMVSAVKTKVFSTYHYEAAIASEHLKAKDFNRTNWDTILMWYEQLEHIAPSPFNKLNMAVVNLQRKDPTAAREILDTVDPHELEQRAYLYHGCLAEYHAYCSEYSKAITQYDQAIQLVNNEAEREYLMEKRDRIKDI